MPKVKHFPAMEKCHAEDLKHVKRKAAKEVSRNSTEELPSKMPRKTLTELRNHPTPGRFLRLENVFEHIRAPKTVYEDMPEGEKCNALCVIDDSKNALRRERNLNVSYLDGTIISSNKGSNGAVFVQFDKGRLVHIKLKHNLYHVSRSEQSRTNWEPMNPQPDVNSLFKVCRYYSELAGSINRRVTAVSGKDLKPRALIEYIHVDARKTRKPKVQSWLETYHQKLAEGCDISNEKAGHKDTDAEEQAYVIPEVYIKTEENGKDKENDQQEASQNTNIKMQREGLARVLDEDYVMIDMLEDNPSVQAVINRKNKSPSVILYNDKQLSEMKRNLEFGGVLGIDCTYKIGDCFVTMTVYQNSRALHRETYEPLLYLGPVFLHSDEEFLTYMSFFSHIMDKLEDTELNFEVKLGCDLELSLFKALEHTFPASVQMINTHHLKTLVYKHLLHITDIDPKTRSAISLKICGPKGIISSPSLSVFQDRIKELQEYFDKFPGLKKFFDKLQLFLYPYICEPLQRGVSQKLWDNGNDEVLNELLHTYLNGRLHNMSDIVESICTITGRQMMKLESA